MVKESKDRNRFLEAISWIPMKFYTKYFQGEEEIVVVDLNKVGVNIQFPFYIGKERGLSSLSSELRCFKIREPNNLKHFSKFITKDDVLLDVGANFGFFSILGKRAKKIIAIEPVKECNDILKKNLALNNLTEKTKIFNIALGSGDKLFMNKSESSNLSKVVEDSERGNYVVESKPLRYFVDKYNVNCVKMDVEGYEWEIFSKQKIPKEIDKITLEFHRWELGMEKSEKLIKIFYDQGFIVRYFLEDMPLRFYPFIGIKFIFNRLTYVKRDLSLKECIEEMEKGRGIKYLYLVKDNKKLNYDIRGVSE